MKAARNVAIILVLAAAVAFLPAAGLSADLRGWLVSAIFLGSLAWFAARMYRQFQPEIMGLGDQVRGLLYGSLAVMALTLSASKRLLETPAGTIAWCALLAAAVAGLVAVVRHWRADRAY